MKKVVIFIEVVESIKNKAKRLAKREDLPLRLLITKLIREAK